MPVLASVGGGHDAGSRACTVVRQCERGRLHESSLDLVDVEIAAARALDTTAAANGTVGDVGIVVFGDAGVAADVGPAAGDQPLTGPGTDANTNGTRDVDEVLSSVHSDPNTAAAGVSLFIAKTPGTPGGSTTNFAAGISAALSAIGASSKPNKLVVYLSDGLA